MSQHGRDEDLHLTELADERNDVEVALDALLARVIDVSVCLFVQ